MIWLVYEYEVLNGRTEARITNDGSTKNAKKKSIG